MVRSPEEKAHRLAAFRGKATTTYFPASEIRPPAHPTLVGTKHLAWSEGNEILERSKTSYEIREVLSLYKCEK
jgi:hypothetical protein